MGLRGKARRNTSPRKQKRSGRTMGDPQTSDQWPNYISFQTVHRPERNHTSLPLMARTREKMEMKRGMEGEREGGRKGGTERGVEKEFGGGGVGGEGTDRHKETRDRHRERQRPRDSGRQRRQTEI